MDQRNTTKPVTFGVSVKSEATGKLIWSKALGTFELGTATIISTAPEVPPPPEVPESSAGSWVWASSGLGSSLSDPAATEVKNPGEPKISLPAASLAPMPVGLVAQAEALVP